MSRRRKLERHSRSLSDVRGIMNSMKTLAYMETRKLDSFLEAQRAVVRNIEEAAADFLSFHPDILPKGDGSRPLFLIVGTERGFCGNFNRALFEHLQAALGPYDPNAPILVPIGRKMHVLLERDERVAAWIDGAGVVEEVTSVLQRVVDSIGDLRAKYGTLDVFCVSHDDDSELATRRLLPPFEDLRGRPASFSYPPVLNVEPSEFSLTLADQYLFAELFAILYSSLMVENHHRVTHLEGAVKHADVRLEELVRKCNALRQEEIIEEIEVILLSAASIGEKVRPPKHDAGR